jgi:hypothetical protein
VYEYADGTEIPYRVEIVSEEERELEIDGEVFHFQGGFK